MQSDVFKKNLIFGYLTCQRLLPNYIFFSKENGYGDPSILKEYLSSIRIKILDPNYKVDFENYEAIIDKITPAPHEFETVLASSALDVCSSVCELIAFITDKNPEHIEAISTAATDSVDMYIQVKENWEMSDPRFEENISFHPLMQRERKTQRDIKDYLAKLDIVDSEDLDTLEKLQYNNGKGNLNL